MYLAGVPWELFSQIGIDAATGADDAVVFLCGYLNGYYGYLGTAEDHARGGYEIDWMPITYGTGTGMPLPMAPEAATTIRTALRSALEKLAPNT